MITVETILKKIMANLHPLRQKQLKFKKEIEPQISDFQKKQHAFEKPFFQHF